MPLYLRYGLLKCDLLVSSIRIDFRVQRTRISQQTPSNSSSFVRIPVPEARLTPTRAKNGPESPYRILQEISRFRRVKWVNGATDLRAALFRNSAARLFVTRFKTLSIRIRLACNPSCTPTFRRTKCLGTWNRCTDRVDVGRCCGAFILSTIMVVLRFLLHKPRIIDVPYRYNTRTDISLYYNPQGVFNMGWNFF